MAGTKRKTGENRWRLEYMFEGERYSQYITASSSTEANRQLALFVAEIEKGQYSRQSNITFVEFAQLFLDKYARTNLSETTVRDYISRLNKYILDYLGNKKLITIRRLHIQEFANMLYEEYNLSSKTIKNYIKLISAILNKAVEWDYIQVNVADKVTIPKNLNKPKKKVILYSYDEINSFLDALDKCKNKELQIAIYSSLVIGGRRGEILALETDDFNIEKSYVIIDKAKISIKNGTKIKDTKTGKERKVYVPKNYMDKVKDYYNYLGNPTKKTPLFTMPPDTYSKRFKEFLKDNNLREINLKDLRALNESILVNQGVDIVAAAKRLGHLPSTATNYYLDQIPQEDKKASKIIENVMGFKN